MHRCELKRCLIFYCERRFESRWERTHFLENQWEHPDSFLTHEQFWGIFLMHVYRYNRTNSVKLSCICTAELERALFATDEWWMDIFDCADCLPFHAANSIRSVRRMRLQLRFAIVILSQTQAKPFTEMFAFCLESLLVVPTESKHSTADAMCARTIFGSTFPHVKAWIALSLWSSLPMQGRHLIFIIDLFGLSEPYLWPQWHIHFRFLYFSELA